MAEIDVIVTQEPIDVTFDSYPINVEFTALQTDIVVSQEVVDVVVTPIVAEVVVEPVVVEVVVGDIPSHEASANPHPQYLTQAEADLLYFRLTGAATTVETETTYGQAPAVGISTDYARADHTHGTPAEVTRETLGIAADDEVGFGSVIISGILPGSRYRLYIDADGNIGTDQVI